MLRLLERTQVLPVGAEDAWAFFSDPRNLARITPPWLDFRVTSPLPERMVEGMLVTYLVRPALGIAVEWVTEITYARAPGFFVDEQRLGPYRFWRHEHHFRERNGATEMVDRVHYDPGYGPLAALIDALMVRGKLRTIFDYRREVIERLFARECPAGGRAGR